MRRIITTVTLTLTAAIPAAAQPTFDARIGFRDDHVLSGTPNFSGDVFGFPSGDPRPFSVLFGAFDAQGFTNRGMFNFIGTITVTDPLNIATLSYRTGNPGSGLRSPYSFGGIESISPDGRTLTFDANRGTGGVDGLLWEFGVPDPRDSYTYPPFTTTPPPGNGGGPDTYFPGERFFLHTGDLTLRQITVTVTGSMQAIDSWFATTTVMPESPDEPGFMNIIPGGFVQSFGSASFSIGFPSPGAALTLGLGALVAARRRR